MHSVISSKYGNGVLITHAIIWNAERRPQLLSLELSVIKPDTMLSGIRVRDFC